MVYDVHDVSTLGRLGNLYQKYLNNGWRGNIILVGNKIDANVYTGVDNYTAKGAQFARDIRAPFIIISAKTGHGVDTLRDTILSSLKPDNIFTQTFYTKSKYCCCTVL